VYDIKFAAVLPKSKYLDKKNYLPISDFKKLQLYMLLNNMTSLPQHLLSTAH